MYLSAFRNIHMPLVLVLCVISGIHGAKRGKLILNLDSITWCSHPDPPYVSPMPFMAELKVKTGSGWAVASGDICILNDMIVNNVTVRTYSKTSTGDRNRVQFEITRATCRNVLVKAYLKMAGLLHDEQQCRLNKGNFTFQQFDFCRLPRLEPMWFREGRYLVELQLATPTATLFCQEIHIHNEKQ